MVMGWTYLPPAEALVMRWSERSVLLDLVLRERLATHRFDSKGQKHPLSESGINQVIKGHICVTPSPSQLQRVSTI
tara:strand:+ start:342 stop:569 length:228 start_codon:yes stop_codon:yes gene_type:complete